MSRQRGGPRAARGGHVLEPSAWRALQAIESAGTSTNTVPALFKAIEWQRGQVNADIGGGKFDTATEWLAARGVTSHVLDPFNRSDEHNERTLAAIDQGVDTVTVANVLNVIAELGDRLALVELAAELAGPRGVVYFSVYAGDGSGKGARSSRGWQENRATETYLEEVGAHFAHVARAGATITAHNRAPVEARKDDDDMKAFALTLTSAPDARLVALRGKLPMLAPDASKTWMQITARGTWEGHPAGSFTFDRSSSDSIIRNFRAQANPVVVYYEHPDHKPDGQPIPAAGWIRDLEARKDGSLWAFVEFTDRAAAMVRAGEYRFCSVVVDFAATSRETAEAVGPELFEVGLVNTPFLDGMQPITLSRRRLAKGTDMPTDADLIKEALKTLGDEATLEAILGWVEAKKGLLAAEAGEAPEPAADAAAEEAAAAVTASAVAAGAAPGAAPAVKLEEGIDSEAGAPDAEGGAADAAAVAALTTAGEQLGMDLTQVVAALTERADEFVAWLGGTPLDGAGADAGAADDAAAGAQLTRAQLGDLRKLAADRKVEADEATARAAELEATILDRDIDDAVRLAKVLDGEAKTLRELAKTKPAMVRARLEEANAGEALATEAKLKAKAKGNRELSAADEATDEFKTYDNSLLGRMPDKVARHAEVRRLMSTREERLTARRTRRA